MCQNDKLSKELWKFIQFTLNMIEINRLVFHTSIGSDRDVENKISLAIIFSLRGQKNLTAEMRF